MCERKVQAGVVRLNGRSRKDEEQLKGGGGDGTTDERGTNAGRPYISQASRLFGLRSLEGIQDDRQFFFSMSIPWRQNDGRGGRGDALSLIEGGNEHKWGHKVRWNTQPIRREGAKAYGPAKVPILASRIPLCDSVVGPD